MAGFFEAKEFDKVRSKKISQEEILVLTLDEKLTEIERAKLLLGKTNNLQIIAVFTNLATLLRQNQHKAQKHIVSRILKDLTFWSDQ